VTQDSAVFWDAAAERLLVVQRCAECGRLRHPPRPMCPHCHSLAVDAVELSGRGTLYSYAILHHPRHPAFDYPVLAALVELDEGVRLVSSLVGVEAADVRIGMPLEVVFEARGADACVPLFRPRSGA
jgi:3-oxo-4,17-pregnadiene-20-carboxyl-CoA hydratase alpha subunit